MRVIRLLPIGSGVKTVAMESTSVYWIPLYTVLEERGIDFRRRPLNLNSAQRQAVGIMPIGGVKSLSTEKPFRVYKGRTEYREWLFTILDLMAPGQRGALVRGGRGGITPQGSPPLNQGNSPGSNLGNNSGSNRRNKPR